MDYDIPDTEIDPVTGKLKAAFPQQNSFVQVGINRKLLYLKSEVDALIAGISRASNPLTTKGDIFGYSAQADRIPVGSDGLALVADSTNPLGVKWAQPSATVTYSVVAKATNYTITDTNDVIKATTSGIVITFPDATTATVKPFTIKNSSNGNISFATTSGQTVDGSTTGSIVPNQALTAVSDGANWLII